MAFHQTFQRGAIFQIKLLLNLARFVTRQLQEVLDIARHTHIDLREQISCVRIERVVEVEYPVSDVSEGRSIRLIGHKSLCHEGGPRKSRPKAAN